MTSGVENGVPSSAPDSFQFISPARAHDSMDETHQPLPEVRQPLVQRTLTEWRTLAVLGGPILIAQVAQMANGVIDTVMAGHASAEDLAAVGIGSSLWMPVFLFFMGLLGALQPIISGYNGARTTEKIMPATWQGFISQPAAR